MFAVSPTPRFRLTLRQSVVLSAVLHACLVAPTFLGAWPSRAPTPPASLAFDLDSLTPEPQPLQEAPRPPEPEKPKEPEKLKEITRRPAPKEAPSHPKVKTSRPTENASPVTTAEETSPPATIAAPAVEAPAPSAVSAEADPLAVYLARLNRKVKRNLAYSLEVRKAGVNGVVTIGFTINEAGHMLTETLHVVRSSGQPAMDKNALGAAIAAAPFDPPPRQVAVMLDITFNPTN